MNSKRPKDALVSTTCSQEKERSINILKLRQEASFRADENSTKIDSRRVRPKIIGCGVKTGIYSFEK